MTAWFMENLATILVGLVLLAVVAAIVLCMYRGRKKGKAGCGCGCANCPMHGSCHK